MIGSVPLLPSHPPPSEEMLRAVRKMAETGKPLMPWMAGIWTYEGCPPLVGPRPPALQHVKSKDRAPEWWTTRHTITGLDRRKWVRPVETPGRLMADWPRAITPLGEQAAAEASPS